MIDLPEANRIRKTIAKTRITGVSRKHRHTTNRCLDGQNRHKNTPSAFNTGQKAYIDKTGPVLPIILRLPVGVEGNRSLVTGNGVETVVTYSTKKPVLTANQAGKSNLALVSEAQRSYTLAFRYRKFTQVQR